MNSLEQNLYLKHNLKDRLQETYYKNPSIFLDDVFWIITNWGGIEFKRLKNNVNNENENIVKEFSSKIYNLNFYLNKREASIISSLSKIASFLLPDECAIYDSRAILSLNWLIFKYNQKYSKKELYFPQPKGSGIASDIDLKFIVRMANEKSRGLGDFKKQYKKTMEYKEEEKYFIFCDLMKELSKSLYTNLNLTELGFENKPYIAEMFLFVLADRQLNYIDKDILNFVSLKFN